MIEINPKRPSCIFSARTRDINVKAERVVLRAIKYFGAMAGDNFVAEDIVPWCSSLVLTSWLTVIVVRAKWQNETNWHTWSKALWRGGSPLVVVGYQNCGSPDLGTKIDAGLVNLDKLERWFFDLFALLVRVFFFHWSKDSFIIKKGRNLHSCSRRHSWRRRGVRPGRPLKLDGSAGSNCIGDVGVDSILMADDIGISTCGISLRIPPTKIWFKRWGPRTGIHWEE